MWKILSDTRVMDVMFAMGIVVIMRYEAISQTEVFAFEAAAVVAVRLRWHSWALQTMFNSLLLCA